MSNYNPYRKKNRKSVRLNKKEEREKLKEAERLKKEAERKAEEEKQRQESDRIKKLGRKKDRKGKRIKRKSNPEQPVKKEDKKEDKHPKKIHNIRSEREKRKDNYKKPRPAKVKQNIEKKKDTVRKKNEIIEEFNYERVYTIPGKYYMSISYRDLTCEKSLNQILNKYTKMSNKDLIKSLKRIVSKRGNFDYELYKSSGGKEGTSNGVAGKANFRLGNMIDIQSDRYKKRNESEAGRKRNEKRIAQGKKPLFTHDGKYDYYQEVTSKGSPFIKTFTPRNLLILLTGIMNNITEVEREDFWNSVIHEFSIIMPEVLEFLPH